jgi:hypothetical protein
MTYARARLWLGIYSVGTIVTLATLALVLGAPQVVHSSWSGSLGGALFLLGVVTLGLLFPFDLLGGYLLPWEYQRSRENLASFLGRWLRGASLQACALVLGLTWLHLGARLAGPAGSIVAAWLGTQFLLMLQPSLARWVGRLEPGPQDLGAAAPALAFWGLQAERPVVFLEARDQAFSGGWAGLPGEEVLVLPEAWRELEPRGLAIQVARRLGVLRTGSRWRGVRLAQAWVVGGWAAVLWLTGADVATLPGLLHAWLAFQLWSFLGLLALPTPSRAGVLEADAFAVAQGVSPVALLELAGRLDVHQEDEPVRAPHIETVFHPIPSLATRQARLEDFRSSPRGAWQAARMALYLSWAVGGVLSRGVHCNLGRPELWVFLPSD